MPAFATIPTDSGQKDGALEGAESRRGRTVCLTSLWSVYIMCSQLSGMTSLWKSWFPEIENIYE